MHGVIHGALREYTWGIFMEKIENICREYTLGKYIGNMYIGNIYKNIGDIHGA
jgi:hypothetical protein